MREISPAENVSVEDFFNMLSEEGKKVVENIRAQKKGGLRPKPSSTMIDDSNILNRESRTIIIDKVAELVDENLAGRSEMCIQFADLVQKALTHLQISSEAIIGDATYYYEGKKVFNWQHAWVIVENEIVDCNVDSTYENPCVPAILKIKPYWGPITKTPKDRILRKNILYEFPFSEDVENIWWPELKEYLDNKFR